MKRGWMLVPVLAVLIVATLVFSVAARSASSRFFRSLIDRARTLERGYHGGRGPVRKPVATTIIERYGSLQSGRCQR